MTIKTYYANEAKDKMIEANKLFDDAEKAIQNGEYEKSNALTKLAGVKYNMGFKTLKWAMETS